MIVPAGMRIGMTLAGPVAVPGRIAVGPSAFETVAKPVRVPLSATNRKDARPRLGASSELPARPDWIASAGGGVSSSAGSERGKFQRPVGRLVAPQLFVRCIQKVPQALRQFPTGVVPVHGTGQI